MENKKFYVTIKGKQIEVTEEVYRAYVRPIRNEQRQKRRDWKCKFLDENGRYVRCANKCEECPYAQHGKKPRGNNLSLEEFKECGVEIVDETIDIERSVVEAETRQEKITLVHTALVKLLPRQKEVITMIWLEGKTQEQVAKKLGIKQSTVSITLERAMKRLTEILKN